MLQILLPPPPECWDYRHVSPQPVYTFPEIELKAPCTLGKHSIPCSGIILSTKHRLLFVMVPWADLSHLEQNFSLWFQISQPAETHFAHLQAQLSVTSSCQNGRHCMLSAHHRRLCRIPFATLQQKPDKLMGKADAGLEILQVGLSPPPTLSELGSNKPHFTSPFTSPPIHKISTHHRIMNRQALQDHLLSNLFNQTF